MEKFNILDGSLIMWSSCGRGEIFASQLGWNQIQEAPSFFLVRGQKTGVIHRFEINRSLVYSKIPAPHRCFESIHGMRIAVIFESQ